ncbi:MAG: hydrogenase maturation nickel metallochaperone HypA [Planctomycetales bacterium]|nr:hydrogenase maturation nickel metallochaperone HypA [Planctomycetales bacterium]
MHEQSLVKALCAQILVAAAPLAADKIRQVKVAIGPLSGVDPILVQSAVEQVRTGYGLTQCELQIEHVELEALCRDCHSRFTIKDFVFRCAECKSSKVQVTQGDEFQLLSVTVEEMISD